ncbi:MAG: hypothetical protein RMK94_07650 [Armatimonadota bacterium]|nr:hypothetical protein [Armatimonadota bacterium]
MVVEKVKEVEEPKEKEQVQKGEVVELLSQQRFSLLSTTFLAYHNPSCYFKKLDEKGSANHN